MKAILKELLLLSLLSLLWGISGCKDTDKTHSAAILEKCKIYLDTSSWDNAIETCSRIESDEGWHLTAQAYMARGGFNFLSLITNLNNLSGNTGQLIYNYVPTTLAKENDFRYAISTIMKKITTKTDLMHWEVLLMSGILIFKELKDLANLTLSENTFHSCMDTASCSFDATVDSPATILSYSGLGSDFYEGLCNDITPNSTVETTVSVQHSLINDVWGSIDYDATIDNCTVQTSSLLYYNKIAYDHYSLVTTDDYSSLAFYNKMDIGGDTTADVDGTTINFCGDANITLSPASDLILKDCEMLKFLKNPGL